MEGNEQQLPQSHTAPAINGSRQQPPGRRQGTANTFILTMLLSLVFVVCLCLVFVCLFFYLNEADI